MRRDTISFTADSTNAVEIAGGRILANDHHTQEMCDLFGGLSRTQTAALNLHDAQGPVGESLNEIVKSE
jgi:hypothetical protein